MRVPSSYKWIFFGGKKPPFQKGEDINILISILNYYHKN